ncbi:S1 domain-containing RNA-binding protein [Tumebacillus permanentifrigoris]|uniref:S1 RNA binding domain protein n=1 Tax=Tumebacillus permanentifrigoris TaxID=378543 RepID=A0A316D6Y2_9BACL|nr:S1 domain-containing RNA-binding protein [Tumebacillus permanentifrigoris]PWK07867.1 S1 RNA binding domain protein [Tumebacillus permanentifrigoris]
MAIELGSKLQGKVTGITHFGAFVLLPGNVTGLVHISEIADTYVKDINEHLKVNDEVTVKVINVDKDGKIGLSIRQAKEPVEGEAPREYRPRGDRPPGPSGPRGDRPMGGGGGGGRPMGGGGGGRPMGGGNRGGGRGGQRPERPVQFEDKLTRFLKESEDRLSALKRNESKRGGRGGRRG